MDKMVLMALWPQCRYSQWCRPFFVTLFFWQILNHTQATDALGRSSRRISRYHQDIKGKILELQCYANCSVGGGDVLDEKPRSCHSNCLRDLIRRPRLGSCPGAQGLSDELATPLQRLSCLDNCAHDFDCPEVQKCCKSTCGPVCMDVIGVREEASLPPVPNIVDIKVTRRHKALITIQSSANSTYYCHVEVRFHFGLLFAPRKLGPWQWQLVEKIAERLEKRSKKTIEVAFSLKPGRWYQVRVAAINANGFRGYSEHSREFRLTSPPKPPKEPADLQVVAAHLDGGHYRVKIVWCPSKSNLPIEKYKIIWSLYVRSTDESLISNEAYVKDAHQYEITKLLPDSSYFIQVQAMSINGSRRLKSAKHSLLYNTTMPAAPYKSLKCTHQYQDQESEYGASKNSYNRETIVQSNNASSVKSSALLLNTAPSPTYKVYYRLNRKVGMIVQITGFHPYKEKVYELCPKDTSCEQREYNAIRAKKDSLEFSKLKYDTTYQLKAFKANAVASDKSATQSFTFTTPKCEKLSSPFRACP